MYPGKFLTTDGEATVGTSGWDARFANRFLTAAGRTAFLEKGLLGRPGAASDAASLALRPAGLALSVRGLSTDQIAHLRGVFDAYLAPSDTDSLRDEPTWILDCTTAAPGWFRTAAEAGAGEAFWDYFLDLDSRSDGVRAAGLDFFLHLHRPPNRRLVAALPADLSGGRLEQAMHNLLRVATAFAVADAGGLLLHSAALLGEGAQAGRDIDGSQVAVVCPGRSGAGKSTLSGRGQDIGWRILSDELNVLLFDDDQLYAEQVPFTGDLGRLERRPGRFPVAAVLPLARTGRDERPRLSPADFYARVMSEAVFANTDPWTATRLETTVERLTRWAAARDLLQALSFTPLGQLDALHDLASPAGAGVTAS